jgi:hypothetical protein
MEDEHIGVDGLRDKLHQIRDSLMRGELPPAPTHPHRP